MVIFNQDLYPNYFNNRKSGFYLAIVLLFLGLCLGIGLIFPLAAYGGSNIIVIGIFLYVFLVIALLVGVIGLQVFRSLTSKVVQSVLTIKDVGYWRPITSSGISRMLLKDPYTIKFNEIDKSYFLPTEVLQKLKKGQKVVVVHNPATNSIYSLETVEGEPASEGNDGNNLTDLDFKSARKTNFNQQFIWTAVGAAIGLVGILIACFVLFLLIINNML